MAVVVPAFGVAEMIDVADLMVGILYSLVSIMVI